MIPRDADGQPVPLDRDLGREFLYARYDTELSERSLEELGLSGLDPFEISRLDSVQHLEELRRVGRALARRVDIGKQFGTFV